LVQVHSLGHRVQRHQLHREAGDNLNGGRRERRDVGFKVLAYNSRVCAAEPSPRLNMDSDSCLVTPPKDEGSPSRTCSSTAPWPTPWPFHGRQPSSSQFCPPHHSLPAPSVTDVTMRRESMICCVTLAPCNGYAGGVQPQEQASKSSRHQISPSQTTSGPRSRR
jgi:hypothetical protein